MKVVHVLKKIEEIDLDIKELRRLEKAVKKNKSFSTPIYMSIEKQINILLGERIKLLELKIENPPESMVQAIESEAPVHTPILTPAVQKEKAAKPKAKKAKHLIHKDLEEEEIRMLTQDDIDSRISSMKKDAEHEKASKKGEASDDKKSDESVKLLDIALEKGSLGGKDETKDKKVKFFRDNFPLE